MLGLRCRNGHSKRLVVRRLSPQGQNTPPNRNYPTALTLRTLVERTFRPVDRGTPLPDAGVWGPRTVGELDRCVSVVHKRG